MVPSKGDPVLMQGKTHIAAGAALAVALLRPEGAPELVAFGFTGAIGGLLPDVDLLKNNGSKEMPACAGMLMLATAALLAVDCVAPFGLLEALTASSGRYYLPGIVWLLVLVAIGVSRPHREFTHSGLFCILASIGMVAASPVLAGPFCVGVISHLALDVLNKRGLCLLWPSKRRFCLRFCSSGGVVDAALLVAALCLLCWAALVRSQGGHSIVCACG